MRCRLDWLTHMHSMPAYACNLRWVAPEPHAPHFVPFDSYDAVTAACSPHAESADWGWAAPRLCATA